MKRVLFTLLAIISLTFACVQPAMAQSQPSTTDQLIGVTARMDDAQKAELLTAAQHIQYGDSTVSKTKEWVDIGASLGQALASTAKEMNIAVNDFARSPVGKLAIALIVWKVIGGTIIHLVAALFCVFLLLGWYRMFRNMFGKYDTESKKIIGFDLGKQGDFTTFFMCAFGVGMFIAGLASLLTA